MHHLAPTSSQMGFLPSMYTFSGSASLPESDLRSRSTSGHLPSGALSNNTWETRCLRKHRRRVDDEGCHAKRRRLAEETDSSHISACVDWPLPNNGPPKDHCVPRQLCPGSGNLSPLHASSPSRTETESTCMDIEAAQRTLQEIENRITLEDDDEDLDVEPDQRRPVLVISDSLKEGLQRGISDILPHTVAQSVSHSCMELVLWRPPEDPFCRRLKGSLQKQRKQQNVLRQPPTPCPSPTPHSAPADTHGPLQNFPDTERCAVEDMEM
ncbi:coiled-coil domain-containing protein 117 [Corythoichthys intestinalis]|uniref:coiled-coil domain-containing protein 117 n=1 Tax=Corythoichthys intestinalis TaxID=161448 RepID=UPI0025A613CA|nr:coiled-coil domain-containing protein 117 [Corythoichthys intestinalis]XP_057687882.1 coiled-coil domain-containing protein 117 [Corythoichthys intestinalis]XP_057687883.1 coiled-coil domain-containing protein 117 [Corythoichthys intestinalis]XP_057687884.1 coiled-coil domain-containing protein 117 [Corythoichthys intestinalis]XP_061803879.1 coiled-coil domain-containing protein 117-like [Nerophis lumbriciformis]